MHTLTPQPRLLVKMPSGSGQFKLSFGAARFNVKVEPLFQSVDKARARGLGAAASARWHVVTATAAAEPVNAWDLAHHLVRGGMGVSGLGQPQFVEPDLEQRWLVGDEPRLALTAAKTCEDVEEPDKRLPTGDGLFWFRDDSHSQLERARRDVGEPGGRVRIAHLDTGYDPSHVTLPRFLRRDLQKNFVDEDRPDDATDRSSGLLTNLGHGTGTLSILAGADVDGVPLGGAAFLEVIPVRVADSVVLFKNSAIARAFDYVHSLAARADVRADVITMSMGGLASQAWAEAVNALYEAGVFVVTAAGNNFGNFPTHNIVYPARFKRVVAACGVMADGTPYADLPHRIMAGNYGPASKMETAMAAYTPNTPWARLGCSRTVDHDGRGTSAATPQVAAAAVLWIQKNRDRLSQYPESWMRVEAVREALFGTARLSSQGLRERLGNGIVQAFTALSHAPASTATLAQRKQPEDSVSFPFFSVLTGLGAAAPDARHRMLELEALQLTQRSHELEQLLPDPSVAPGNVSEKERREFADALADTPGASTALRESLRRGDSPRRSQVAVPQQFSTRDAERVKKAMEPPLSEPVSRRLRVFAYDPLLGTRLDTMSLNETTLEVRWEKDLAPGPVGEYLEVVDVDPPTGVCYAPVDLNHPLPVSQAGLSPSESSPRFHQQMVYAVAMKTIEHFEYALGRVALWAPRFVRTGGRDGGVREQFVRRLRVYPHAIREENSFYSPEKKALLFGYFSASESDPGENLPGQTVFCCLSHDIVAHETTHALLDGLHRRFHEPTNEDVLAFHEAFADIVALFQHFTVPEALRSVIARTRGNLGQQNMLGQLAQQFGQATGTHGALRDAIGHINEKGEWEPTIPTVNDYQNATEPHDRGAVLVAAVFEAFLNIYRMRSEDLIRLSTGGTGVLPPGAIPHDLVMRLSQEASKAAAHVLNICIRALDYCPPVDITFGDYVRALVTADRDLVPDDDLGYRVAFIQAFRRRGIYPRHVRSLTTESVCWDSPELKIPIAPALNKMSFTWDLHANRMEAYKTSRLNAAILHNWISLNLNDEQALTLGFYRSEKARKTALSLPSGQLSNFEVHSVRPVRRVGPDDQQQLDLIVEITQSWRPDGRDGEIFRGGSTLIIDLEKSAIRYCIRKRVANAQRVDKQRSFRMALAAGSPRNNYFNDSGLGREPFALIHRAL